VTGTLKGVPSRPASDPPELPPAPLGSVTLASAQLPRVTFAPGSFGSILVHGTYPHFTSRCVRPVQPVLHARYPGRIEVGKDTDGRLFIIGVLPFEDYLKGIAEEPRTWPLEALKAQAVAARSYALAHVRYGDSTGERLGYQLCATDACQVYLGLGISNGPYGDRWRQAVDDTRGQVLLYNGSPADSLYFSTSNGHTLGNDEVFGTDPLPYLRPVTEDDDGASPVSHWRVQIPFSDVARFLGTAGEWGSAPVTGVRRSGPNVIVSGGGTSKAIGVVTFRSALNSWGHCLEPDRYPGANLVNGASLPQTVPSRWFGTTQSIGSVLLAGRGWGHGVGMVQWGAYGKASRGLSYGDILSAYYGGLRPQTYSEPSEIRIGIAVGLSSIRVAGAEPQTAAGRAAGPGSWLVTGGSRFRVTPAKPPPKLISPGTLQTTQSRARAGRTISATITLPQLSVVRLVIPAGGHDAQVSKPVTLPAGTSQVSGTAPNLPTREYRLEAVVSNGVDYVRTNPVPLQVFGGHPTASPSVSPSPSPVPPSPSPPSLAAPAQPAKGTGPAVPVVLGIATAAVVALGLLRVRQRRLARRRHLARLQRASGPEGPGHPE
jgi:SpoIID/LytB domain protein